ncbi:MAG: polymer-forming cytoskeletal protein [Thermoanaerobaculia bacterium]|nr:polymer-forming cytoskeletal protein [Thermoanaerobaculia bacterium]
MATIGPSIAVKGDLSGEEDLMIEGRIEGEIRLQKNSVTVGKSGRVKADIYGRSIGVEGEVRGNLYGDHEVVIRASGRVQGNIVSPRVILENGSKFKGSVDMEPARKSAEPPVARPPQGGDGESAKPKKGDEAQAGLKPAAGRR